MLRFLSALHLLLLLASPFCLGAAFNVRNQDPTLADLGSAGRYRGIVQNDGKVVSWKGIPYAKPPVGKLRFQPPHKLSSVNDSIVDVSDDALRCVQFSGSRYGQPSANIVGVKAGPGVEDCLKIWIWKPINATKGDKLPVSFYIHGGGLQYSAAANNDFSDWVAQSQDFIAVNVGYRVGALGFFSDERLPSANAGLLDQRLALEWVRDNIEEFGGDPKEVTILGQSGGGFAVVSQLALYDGDTQGLFNKAVARSIQRSPQFTVAEYKERNAAFAKLAGCDGSKSDFDCLVEATPEALVNAYASLTNQTDPGYFPKNGPTPFIPTVDGKTLTDRNTNLFISGKVANIPSIFSYVNDEFIAAIPTNLTALTPDLNTNFNLTDAQVERLIDFYPVNSTFGDSGPSQVYSTVGRAALAALNSGGDCGSMGATRLYAKYLRKNFGGKHVWSVRFNAPAVGTTPFGNTSLPLGYVAHSADNSYLQNSTAKMTPYEKNMAIEWRSYIGSFIRTGDPNRQKLATAPKWPTYEEYPFRLVPALALSNTSMPTGTDVEISPRAQIERIDNFWLSPEILEATRA
ncbi:alpha/beta-hydrolase [Violaceomyces palustris]|uniref:Alpha/beta-hydrolase n=1 Tax=Violaceomyces palustris TaxID=1673888 RepID=A0ACD0P706_9BASI|nr:alpha/beta-hydrolase [Violaceomyces palustris]